MQLSIIRDANNNPMIRSKTLSGVVTERQLRPKEYREETGLKGKAARDAYIAYKNSTGDNARINVGALAERDRLVVTSRRNLKGGGFVATYKPRAVEPAQKLSKMKQLEQENAKLRAEQAKTQAKMDKLMAKLGIEA